MQINAIMDGAVVSVDFVSNHVRCNDESCFLVVVRGISGSGKTTLANAIVGETNVFEADKYFEVDGKYVFNQSELEQAHRWCRDRVEDAMRVRTTPLGVANTFTRKWEMEPYFVLAKKYNYSVIVLEPATEWRKDAKQLATKNRHGVPIASIRRMMSRWEASETP